MKDIVSKGRIWGKPIDQMDVWLDTQGYYRKHTARDGTCLFRAVSEQLFLTQVFHPEVRRQIVDYQLRHADFFQRMVNCPLEIYADKMRNSREWGGKIEIIAMAMFYRHDFEMFLEIGKPPELITHFNFGKVISLCYSQDRHYDSVYTKDYIATTAFCQSVVYEVLYKRVFDLKEVDYAVKKMLHDKTSRYQREHFPFLGTGFALRLEMRDTYLNVKDLLDYGITPFPYKVAKSLDCEVYRNVEYDTWNEYRKGLRYGFCAWTCRELQVGVKCLVKIDEETSHHGHIQEMKPNKGPVVVFIEELGEMMTVPYDSLEMLPQSAPTSPMKPPVRVFPIKLPPIIQDEEGNKAKRILKAVPVRPKLKELNNFSNKQEVVNKDPSKETQNPTVSSSEYYEEDIDYQQNETPPQSRMSPQAVAETEARGQQHIPKPENVVPLFIPLEPYRYPTYTVNPPMTLPIPETSITTYQPTPPSPVQPVNLMAKKSINIDGSDLPHSDVATLRFFYNLGLDHLRMNCGPWNIRPGNTYYVNSVPPTTGYIPVESPSAPMYDPAFTQIPGVNRRDAINASPGLISIASEADCAQNRQIPPRFKNKNVQNVPAIQQCEITSTTNVGVPYSPVYYPQMECEQTYCMTTIPYVDYNVYEYPTHGYVPTSFVGADGLVYQTILTPASVTTTPTV